MIDALQSAHDAGIIHRDIKPDNIFLARSSSGEHHPVVLDFGISKVEDSDARLTKTSALMGTPYYMSPEQARGARKVDARSDQFSLGLVLYEALAGARAVEGESMLEIVHKISMCEFVALAQRRPDLPESLVATVNRMIARSPEERFPSLRHAGRALLPYASEHVAAQWRRAFDATGMIANESSGGMSPPRVVNTLSGTTGEVPRGGIGPLMLAGSAALLVIALGSGMAVLGSSGTPSSPDPAIAGAAREPPVIPSSPSSYEVRLTVGPRAAEIRVDGELAGTGQLSRSFAAGSTHRIELSHPGYIPHAIGSALARRSRTSRSREHPPAPLPTSRPSSRACRAKGSWRWTAPSSKCQRFPAASTLPTRRPAARRPWSRARPQALRAPGPRRARPPGRRARLAPRSRLPLRPPLLLRPVPRARRLPRRGPEGPTARSSCAEILRFGLTAAHPRG